MSTVKVSEKKKQTVEKLKKDLTSYPIIGLVKIDNIDASVVQRMRKDLRNDAKIVMAKNSLMRIAVSDLKKKVPGIEQILDYIVGSCAFLLTSTNPKWIPWFFSRIKFI